MHTPRRFLTLSALATIALVLAACSGSTGAGGAATPSAPLTPETPPVASVAPSESAQAAASPVGAVFGDPVGQVRCDLGGHDDSYHIHSALRIFIDGAESDPDNNIGVDETKCMYWVHTHDATGGVVHIEAPQNVAVTLGDFMDVWAVSYPNSRVYKAALAGLDAGGLTVDGAKPAGPWQDVALADGLRLEIR